MGQRSAFSVPCCLMPFAGRRLNSGIRSSSMKNVVIIACLLFGAFLVAVLCGADRALSGRVGISAVFFFTALGHFAKPEEMMHMLPAGVPQRRLVILLRVSLGFCCSYQCLLPVGWLGNLCVSGTCYAFEYLFRDPSSSVRRALLWALVSRDSSPTTGPPV